MALKVAGVGMQFDSRWVLRDVSIEFRPGEIHGLVGHNGSGKSTLIKILAGFYNPAAGTVRIDGENLAAGGAPAAAARRLGLRFVHQDLGLIPDFSAVENMGVGGSYTLGRARTLDWDSEAKRLGEVLRPFGVEVPLRVPVKRLSAVQRALVSIGRAIAPDDQNDAPTRFLVLDEPTTTLEGPEVGHLFDVVRSMSSSGIGVIYVSHNLRDVMALSSRISVLRDGELVRTFPDAQTTRDELLVTMLGGTLAEAEHRAADAVDGFAGSPAKRGRPRLSVRGLHARGLSGADLDVYPGECVCVMGLSGSGREQLTYAIAGATPSSVQSMDIDGTRLPGLKLHTCQDYGVALVPGNRMPGSLVADFRIRENLSLVSLGKHRGWLRMLNFTSERRATTTWASRLGILPPDPDTLTRHLSGGNKQKVVLAKWLETDPRLMLIDEPTAGVDIGAAQKLLGELRRLVAEGRSLLITTSETDDTIVVADRVLIMNEGRVTHELIRGRDEITEKSLLTAMNQVPAQAAASSNATGG